MEFEELMNAEAVLLNGYNHPFRKINDSKDKVILYELNKNLLLLIDNDDTVNHYAEVVNWLAPYKLNAIVRHLKHHKNVLILLHKSKDTPTEFKVYQGLDISSMYFMKMTFEQIMSKLDDSKLVDITITNADYRKAEKDRIKYNKEHGTNY